MMLFLKILMLILVGLYIKAGANMTGADMPGTDLAIYHLEHTLHVFTITTGHDPHALLQQHLTCYKSVVIMC